MKKVMTTLLMVAAMAGAACTGNAQNREKQASENDTAVAVSNDTGSQAAPEDSICDNPDVRPKYNAKDSMPFLLDFLNKNVHYPKEAEKNGISGTVIVQMVVEKDGTPTHFKVIREADPLLDEEALRIAQLLPKFIPAQKDGKPVRCIFNFSVPFRCK